MFSVLAQPDMPEQPECGHVGGIPVRNLWLLMLFASDLFRCLDSSGKVAFDDNPEEIADLVCKILAREVDHRLSRNLSFGYQPAAAELGRVRGRIDLLSTERHQLLQRGKIACRFEELTVDTPRNRYVRAALDKAAGLVKDADLVRYCRSLSASMNRIGVGRCQPKSLIPGVDRCGRNDAHDRNMIAAARLVFEMAMPSEAEGLNRMHLPSRDIAWLRKLYEKGVAGFYDHVLDKSQWKVRAGQSICWQIEDSSPGIAAILPNMRTDIVLESRNPAGRLVIDTKFNGLLKRGWYRDEVIRSAYLYQMYAYLRSQESDADPLSLISTGLLLHPSIDNSDVDEYVVIQGHRLRFATVNLAAGYGEIRDRLVGLV